MSQLDSNSVLINDIHHLKNKVSKVDEKVDFNNSNATNKINDLTIVIGDIRAQVASNEAYLENHKAGLEKLEIKFEKLEESNDLINNKVTQVERKVDNLETTVKDVNNKMDNLTTDVKTMIAENTVGIKKLLDDRDRENKRCIEAERSGNTISKLQNTIFILVIIMVLGVYTVLETSNIKHMEIIRVITLMVSLSLKPVIDVTVKKLLST